MMITGFRIYFLRMLNARRAGASRGQFGRATKHDFPNGTYRVLNGFRKQLDFRDTGELDRVPNSKVAVQACSGAHQPGVKRGGGRHAKGSRKNMAKIEGIVCKKMKKGGLYPEFCF